MNVIKTYDPSGKRHIELLVQQQNLTVTIKAGTFKEEGVEYRLTDDYAYDLPAAGNLMVCGYLVKNTTDNSAHVLMEDDCRAAPNVLLPGWMETEGNSVLLNGQPVNGHVVRVQIGTPPGQPPVPPTVEFRLIGPNGAPFTVALMVGMRVRVTGVINLDEHAEGPPDFHGAPEIHPVYAIDFLQNFRQPRPGADLTGVWHANDVGTYYLRQVDGNVLWWLGLSRDQGRTFANVFQGTIQNNTITGD